MSKIGILEGGFDGQEYWNLGILFIYNHKNYK